MVQTSQSKTSRKSGNHTGAAGRSRKAKAVGCLTGPSYCNLLYALQAANIAIMSNRELLTFSTEFL